MLSGRQKNRPAKDPAHDRHAGQRRTRRPESSQTQGLAARLHLAHRPGGAGYRPVERLLDRCPRHGDGCSAQRHRGGPRRRRRDRLRRPAPWRVPVSPAARLRPSFAPLAARRKRRLRCLPRRGAGLQSLACDSRSGEPGCRRLRARQPACGHLGNSAGELSRRHLVHRAGRYRADRARSCAGATGHGGGAHGENGEPSSAPHAATGHGCGYRRLAERCHGARGNGACAGCAGRRHAEGRRRVAVGTRCRSDRPAEKR